MVARPMLAYTPKSLEELEFPLLGSPKLDGVRALLIDGVLMSRKLKPIRNTFLQDALTNSDFNGCDGELVAGEPTGQGVFHRTTSAVMTEAGTPQVTFWIFDRFDLGHLPYGERINHLPQSYELLPGVHIKPLKHTWIKSVGQLRRYERICLDLGYEGVMVRHPAGLYKQGRSGKTDRWLCKIKQFEDAEAECIGIIEQQHNGNEATINELGYTKRSSHKANRTLKGTTGALVCRTQGGIEFQIGTGMNDALRAEFWAEPPIGKMIKFKFQPTGIKDKPRFPVFLGIRED